MIITVTWSLVAICMCGWSLNVGFQHVKFPVLQCSSPAQNTFVSSTKCHKTCSPLAINMFVFSVIWYLEVNSRDYPIASDEHVHLQYDIVFGGDPGLLKLVQGRAYSNYHFQTSNIKLNWYGLMLLQCNLDYLNWNYLNVLPAPCWFKWLWFHYTYSYVCTCICSQPIGHQIWGLQIPFGDWLPNLMFAKFPL